MKVKFSIRVYTNPRGIKAPFNERTFVDVDHIGTVVRRRTVREDYWTRFDYQIEWQDEEGKTVYSWVPDYRTKRVSTQKV